MGTGRLPTFIIPGSARSGTTALMEALDQHPSIQTTISRVKETHHFSDPAFISPWAKRHRVSSRERYKALFDDTDAAAWGEASPGYMDPIDAPRIANAIRADIPDARILITIRSPVDRLWSTWLAIEQKSGADIDGFVEFFNRHQHDVSRGLQPYFDVFRREQILVLPFEYWTRRDMWDQIFAHLKVNRDFRPITRQANRSGAPKSAWKAKVLSIGTELRSKALVYGLPMPERILGPIRTRLHRARERNLAPTPKLPQDVRSKLVRQQIHEVSAISALCGWSIDDIPQEWLP